MLKVIEANYRMHTDFPPIDIQALGVNTPKCTVRIHRGVTPIFNEVKPNWNRDDSLKKLKQLSGNSNMTWQEQSNLLVSLNDRAYLVEVMGYSGEPSASCLVRDAQNMPIYSGNSSVGIKDFGKILKEIETVLKQYHTQINL